MLTLLSVFNYKSFLYVTMNNFGWVQNKYIKNYNDMWVCTGGGCSEKGPSEKIDHI